MQLERAKGTRDLGPEEQIIVEHILVVLKKNFEIFAFNPIDTPILERFSTLASKYTGGTEILKETFKVEDQGGRDLGLRYDLTVPFSRFIAMNPQLKMPFKRYQIGRVFRDGPVSVNRFRELTQCDCDIVGSKSMTADAECLDLFFQCFKDLNLEVIIKLNNRKILDAIMNKLNIQEESRERVILAVDKLDKKSEKEIIEEIKSLTIPQKTAETLLGILNMQGANPKIIKEIEKLIGSENQGLQELKELLALCPSPNLKFTPSLARGLSYYTSTIFEVFLKNSEIKTSIASGGRYDKMIGNLLESSREYPAVGCSFGLDRIFNALKEREKTSKKTVALVYIIPIGIPSKTTLTLVKKLRDEEIPTDFDLMGRGISKNLEYANTLQIPFVVFMGENEVKKKKYKLKNMKTGKESLLAYNSLLKKLQ